MNKKQRKAFWPSESIFKSSSVWLLNCPPDFYGILGEKFIHLELIMYLNIYHSIITDQKPFILYHVTSVVFYHFPTSAEFQDTVQSNVPGVVWNGEPASNGGTLPYCPFGTKCFLQFSAITSSSLPLSPDVYIDGVCYPFTELEKKFQGSSANATQYPLHNFLFDCGNITRFRVVYNETYYTREFKLERSDCEFFITCW